MYRPIVFVLSLLVLVLGFLVNRSQEYVEFASRERSLNFVDMALSVSKRVTQKAAGWPWCYQESIAIDGGAPIETWDTIRLLGNIVFWGMSASLLFCLLWPWQYKGGRKRAVAEEATTPKQNRFRFRISLRSVFLVSFAVGFVFVYYGWLQRSAGRYRVLKREIESVGGTVTESCWLPRVYLNVPEIFLSQLTPLLQRPAFVSIDNPSSALVQKISQVPRLQSLRLSGGSYSVSDLEPLRSSPFLHDIRISGRIIDNDWLNFLSGCKSLRSINLMRTNLLSSGLKALNGLKNLKYLNLIHTEVQLATDEEDTWHENLVELWLPGPAFGDSYNHSIIGFKSLKVLHCYEYDEYQNASPTLLKVHQCPNLDTVELDSLQLYDLDFANLPRLSTIKTFDYQVENRTRLGDRIASYPWVSRLQFASLPSIENQGLDIHDLKSIEVEDCPKLFIETSWVGRTIANQSGVKQASTVDPRINPEFSSQNEEPEASILDALAKSRGLVNFSINGMNLGKLKAIPPIENCDSIVQWDLSCNGLTEDFIKRISKNQNIQYLIIFSPPPLFARNIEELDFNRIATFFPNLVWLNTNAYVYLERPIVLKNMPFLKYFAGTRYYRATSIEIENMPSLEDELCLDNTLSKLHIRNAPKIKGLTTARPWPANVEIDKLESMECFAAGGPNFGDDDFAMMEQSKGLNWLTIAYSSVQPETLARIGDFRSLRGVSLAGPNFDDTALEGIRKLSGLEYIVIKDTNMSAKVWDWIQSQSNLELLWIDGKCWSSMPSGALTGLSNLKEIRLMNLSLDRATIEPMLAPAGLMVWGFQNAKLTDSAMEAIVERNQLAMTGMNIDWEDCQFESQPRTYYNKLLPSTNFGFVRDGDFVASESRVNCKRRYSPLINAAGERFEASFREIHSHLYQFSGQGLLFMNAFDLVPNARYRLIRPECFLPDEVQGDSEGENNEEF